MRPSRYQVRALEQFEAEEFDRPSRREATRNLSRYQAEARRQAAQKSRPTRPTQQRPDQRGTDHSRQDRAELYDRYPRQPSHPRQPRSRYDQ